MLTTAQEEKLAAAHGRSKKHRQDTVNPMVINIDDGRLMPNVPKLRVHPKYRVYNGPLDASLPQRMKWLEGNLRHLPTVVDSGAAEESFDVGTATLDDLVTFAHENFGAVLDTGKPLKALRKEVLAMAQKATAELA